MTVGPAALLRSLPPVLGRQPADELVLAGVSDLSPDAAVVITTHLAVVETEDDAEETAGYITAAVNQLRRDGARKVAVVVYADDTSADSPAARFAATAVVTAEAAGLGVLDAIAVTNGRWRSYECDDPSCCPPEGTPITEGPTP